MKDDIRSLTHGTWRCKCHQVLYVLHFHVRPAIIFLIMKRVKVLLELGIIPDYLMPHYVEFTPIDEAAAEVMTIARHFSTGQTVFHINSTKVLYMDALTEYCRELGYPMEVVSDEEFTATLRKTMEQSELKHIFETFINDLDESDQLAYDSRIRIENRFTEEYLRRLGFTWAELGMEYRRKYVKYLKEIKYLGGV